MKIIRSKKEATMNTIENKEATMNTIENLEFSNLQGISIPQTLFTIGYEGLNLEDYLNKLIKNDVKLLCDVRRNPLSRKPGFSKKALSQHLEEIGIEYLALRGLGIASVNRQNLKTEEDYQKLFTQYRKELPQKKQDLAQVSQALCEHKRVALTCFEKLHYRCHRHCLSESLEATNQVEVVHL